MTRFNYLKSPYPKQVSHEHHKVREWNEKKIRSSKLVRIGHTIIKSDKFYINWTLNFHEILWSGEWSVFNEHTLWISTGTISEHEISFYSLFGKVTVSLVCSFTEKKHWFGGFVPKNKPKTYVETENDKVSGAVAESECTAWNVTNFAWNDQLSSQCHSYSTRDTWINGFTNHSTSHRFLFLILNILVRI